jgi:predicted 2-oxoglutarate/Fe(II)-dependent dioxygenase YbiX
MEFVKEGKQIEDRKDDQERIRNGFVSNILRRMSFVSESLPRKMMIVFFVSMTEVMTLIGDSHRDQHDFLNEWT